MEKFITYLIENNKIELKSELENYSYQVYSELNHFLRKEKCVEIVFDLQNVDSASCIAIREFFKNKDDKNGTKVLVTNSIDKAEQDKVAHLIIIPNYFNSKEVPLIDANYYYSKHSNISYIAKGLNKRDSSFLDYYFNQLNENICLVNYDLLEEYYYLFLEIYKIKNLKSTYIQDKLNLEKNLEKTYEVIEQQKKLNETLIVQRDNIKKQLSYRVGNLIVSSFKDKRKIKTLPYNMALEFHNFYLDKKNQPKFLKLTKALADNKKNIENLRNVKQVLPSFSKNRIVNVSSGKNVSATNLVSSSVEDFVLGYENLRISFFEKSDLKGLYDITYKHLDKNINDLKAFEPILKEVLQILFYYESISNQRIENILAQSFLNDYAAKREFDKISSFFVEFNSILGWDVFKETLLKNGVRFSDIYQKKYFLESITSRPQAFVPALDEEFYTWAKSQPENYELILAKFLYAIIKGKRLDRETLFGFFNIKRAKFKKRFLDILQRYTYSIKKSIDNEKLVHDLISQINSVEDLIYVSLLISCNSSKKNIDIFISNVDRLSETALFDKYQLAYLVSQVGDNSNLTKIINDRFNESFVKPINYLGNKSIVSIYENILSTVVNTDRNYPDSQSTINVITSTFNPDISLLSLSIDSILNQSHKLLILTIVDDYSDNSKDIQQLIDTKNDSRIKYLRMTENGGVYKCRNSAINSIDSGFIAFQDDDDVSHPQRLEYQLSHLRNSKIEVSMVTNLRIDIDGHVQIDNHSSILSNGPVTMLFHKNLINKVGLFKEFRSRGDVEFKNRCVRLLGPSSLEVDPKILYYSLGSHNSLSSTFEHGKNNSNLKLIRSLIHYDQTKLNVEFRKGSSSDSRIIACMASFPARKEKMLSTIDSIFGNVDKIYLYLNNYQEIPVELKKYDNLEVTLGKDTKGDLRDNGKIYPFTVERLKGYCFLIDDDIIYPPSYFNEFVRKIEKYNRKAVVGVHGVIFAKPFQSYFKNREVFHFKNENLVDVVVNQLGTGALAFHTDTLVPTLDKYVETGMADVFFAIEAKQFNVPLVCIAHPAGWLKPLEIEIEDTSNLYDEFKNDHSKQTLLIKNAGEFKELDIFDI